jgi:hypothetical protein
MNARWQRWRRDLLFALAGVVVVSAVLVPVGWSRVRAERQRAEAAEEEAAKQRAIAEEQTRLARQEAERKKAKRATDPENRRVEDDYRNPNVQARIHRGPKPLTLDELDQKLKELDQERADKLRKFLEERGGN